MIISIWRYSHLALTLCSGLFLLVLSITGTILAFDPISSSFHGAKTVKTAADQNIAETLKILYDQYPEILNLSVDPNGYVVLTAIDDGGNIQDFYIDPLTGNKSGGLIQKSALIQFTTSLHRSLFLKSPGRIFVGISSLLLFLIAISGFILLIKRQQKLKHFFGRIKKDNFFQFSHTYIGRMGLLPLIIIALTGVYLSLIKFSLVPNPILSHEVIEEDIRTNPHLDHQDFKIFQQTKLKDLRSLDFPFSDDPVDYFTLNLKDKEILINQYTGDALSELYHPFSNIIAYWSLVLHTGSGNVTWSVILAFSSLSIPFFMYSGFWMTLKRRSSRIKNYCGKNESEYVILVGSETGTTFDFAKALQQTLKRQNLKCYVAQLNELTHYPKMRHMVVLTATYGVGEPPSNALKFSKLLPNTSFPESFYYSVVGFGSLAYPNYCQYAFEVDKLLGSIPNGKQISAPFTINNRSLEAFKQWTDEWTSKIGISTELTGSNQQPITKRKKTHFFTVKDKKIHGDTFNLLLEIPSGQSCFSGDLLAVYPDKKTHARLYSIGLIDSNILLISVRVHKKGLCSNYLKNLEVGDRIDAVIKRNKGFHFSKRAKKVVMISAGTGITPFLGMLKQKNNAQISLYWGARSYDIFRLYEPYIYDVSDKDMSHTFHPVYSREKSKKTYVQDLIHQQEKEFASLLEQKAAVMICGPIGMQKSVLESLNDISQKINSKPLSYYQNRGLFKMDCY